SRVLRRNDDKLDFISYRQPVQVLDFSFTCKFLLLHLVVKSLKNVILRARIDYAGQQEFPLDRHVLFQDHTPYVPLGRSRHEGLRVIVAFESAERSLRQKNDGKQE